MYFGIGTRILRGKTKESHIEIKRNDVFLHFFWQEVVEGKIKLNVPDFKKRFRKYVFFPVSTKFFKVRFQVMWWCFK